MADPRVTKLAQVLIRYALELQPGEELYINTSPLANELNLEVYKEAILAGAHVWMHANLPGVREIFLKYASEEQLEYVMPLRRKAVEHFPVFLYIMAEHNTRELNGIDSARLARQARANQEIHKIYDARQDKGELRWCLTAYPCHAMAQEADMSLADFEDFVYNAGMLDQPDPVAGWKALHERQEQIIDWLKGKQEATLKGANIDLRLSIAGRSFINCDGKINFPDGEIFTTPVEESAQGWVRFNYPAIYAGREVEDIELWFEDGKVVKESAQKNQAMLTEMLNTDAGARYLGEWGIGTNYAIQRFVKEMLFDEKIGGTIHLALGNGFPKAGGKNFSNIHWDMLCDMADSEILVDGELFYKNGKFVV
jgi:aminopeptidase